MSAEMVYFGSYFGSKSRVFNSSSVIYFGRDFSTSVDLLRCYFGLATSVGATSARLLRSIYFGPSTSAETLLLRVLLRFSTSVLGTVFGSGF